MHFDVAIVGAGPAGSSTALSLAHTGLRVALIDKATFPRDKICGDALSFDVVNQLSLISPSLAEDFNKMADKAPSFGVRIFAPNFNSIGIPLMRNGEKACGFVSPRSEFDNLLFKHASALPNVHCFENAAVEKIEQQPGKVVIRTADHEISASVLIGADGAHSVVAKELTDTTVDKKHYSAGLRIYYENITGFDEDNSIELHFLRDVIPGYLWLFPMSGNRVNVGIGMLSSEVAKKRVNLKEVLKNVIATYPHLKERFKDAKALETVKGFGLPLGSRKIKLSGERFLLTGDAASLIDPFTGEGIANAIRSGRIAAKHIEDCFKQNNFSAKFNLQYEREIHRRMFKEFRISHMLQRLLNYPWLCNLMVNKAAKNGYVKRKLTEALASVDKRKGLFVQTEILFLFVVLKYEEPIENSNAIKLKKRGQKIRSQEITFPAKKACYNLLIIFSIVIYELSMDRIPVYLATFGFFIGYIIGMVVSRRMHTISWNAELNQAVTRMDTLGIIILIFYILFAVSRHWIFAHWVHGYALSPFCLSVAAGGMLGRLFNTRKKIREILKKEGMLYPPKRIRISRI